MGKGYNHFTNCTCGWCNNLRSETDSDGSNYIHAFTEKRNKLINNFSFTIPNAKCSICQQEIFYYENIYGSKVFFEKLGKPWIKHNCFYDAEAQPEINTNTEKIEFSYVADYHPVMYTINFAPLEGNYKLIEVKDSKNTKQKYVIEYPSSNFGICFIEKDSNKIYLNFFIDKEYRIECMALSEAKLQLSNIFPYKISDVIEIEIDVEHSSGIKTEVFINRKISLNTNKIFRCYIYNADLSINSKEKLKENGKIKIIATSKLNKDNEIIFNELQRKL